MNSLLQSNLPIDLRLVYIAEAHAEDEWPIGSQVKLKQHSNIQERQQAANQCIKSTGLKWSILLDSDEFEKQYAPWPIRFYVYWKKDGIVICEWISEPTNGGYYDWNEVEKKIRSFL